LGTFVYVADDGEPLTADQTILSDEGLRALGMVAYWAALVEQVLAEAVRDCSGLTYAKTDVLVEGKTGGALISILRKLVAADAPTTDPEDHNAIPDPAESALTEDRLRVLNLVNLAITARNQILHSAMGGSLEDGHVVLYSKKWKGVHVPESDIRKVADLLCAAFHEITSVDMRALRR